MRNRIIYNTLMRKTIIKEFLRRINFRDERAELIIDKMFASLNDEDLFYTLTPSVSSIFSPFHFRDMFKVCRRIASAIGRNENILIFGDKDVDGMIGTFLLKNFLENLKVIYRSNSQILYDVPEGDEFYGIYPETIEEYKGRISLIITVDNGISAIDALKKASEIGIDFIITDHHELHNNEVLKYSYGIINPKIEDVGKYLSGAGVAFFLILGLLIYTYYREIKLYSLFLSEDKKQVELLEIKNFVSEIKKYEIEELRELIKSGEIHHGDFVFFNRDHLKSVERNIPEIGNIVNKFFYFENILKSFKLENTKFSELCDKYSIPEFDDLLNKLSKVLFLIHTFENPNIRKIVNDYIPLVGLTVLSDSMPIISYNRFFVSEAIRRIGSINIDSVRLLVSTKLGNVNLTPRKIVMKIIPFINSAGRMGKARKMIDLLLEKDIKEIENLLNEIENLDDQRKKAVSEFISSFSTKIKEEKVIVDKKVEKGIISIVATRIANEVDYPIVVISNGGNGRLFSGSARFSKGDVFSIMKMLSHHFENFGGHKKATGFVISEDKIPFFVDDFLKIDYTKFYDTFTPIMRISISEFGFFAPLFYAFEPINEDLKPLFEDEVILQDYRKETYTNLCRVKIGNDWFITTLDENKIRGFLYDRVKIMYSYEFRESNKLGEDLFFPKIFEIRK